MSNVSIVHRTSYRFVKEDALFIPKKHSLTWEGFRFHSLQFILGKAVAIDAVTH